MRHWASPNALTGKLGPFGRVFYARPETLRDHRVLVAQSTVWLGSSGSHRPSTTQAARSPLTLTAVRHISRMRSTPMIKPTSAAGTPTL